MDFSTVLVTLISLLCGAAAGSYFNLKSARKDVLFKRKLEYFEKLAQDIEKNIRNHKKIILSLSVSSKKKNIEKNIIELKQNRKNFFVMASPLYFDITPMTNKITAFVNVEKNIFANLEKIMKSKNKSDKENIIIELNNSLQMLNKAGNSIISEMRLELHKK